MRASEVILLPSGRAAAAHFPAVGQSGRTVVLCHAAPGSGGWDPDPVATAARDVTLIGVDRPGYGGSEPVPAGQWASVAVAADDLAQVLDRLDTGPVGVAGWSAGGRVALALAARRPDLVDRVAVIATPAPDDEVEWIPAELKAGLEAMRDLPPEQVHEALAAQLAGALPLDDPGQAVGMLASADADAQTLEQPGVRRRIEAMLAAAFNQGTVGLAADIAGYCLQPWGFEPSEVAAKTLLIYGARDEVAPRHGKWYQRHVPQARFEQVPDAGHLVIIQLWQRVLSHLAPRR